MVEYDEWWEYRAMARIYTKPPLIEAVCELKFSSFEPWDWTVAGIFYEHIRNEFPIKGQLNTVETQIDLQQGKFIQQTSPQLQFTSQAGDAVIRVAPDTLSFHQLPPYDGWTRFKERTIKYLGLYLETAHPSKLTQITLRYINQIELPFGTEMETYFRLLPQVPTPVPQRFSSFLMNVDIPDDSATNVLKVVFGTVVPKTEGNVAYVLGLNVFNISDIPSSDNHIEDWLEIAHERIEVTFNASFTDRTHQEIFGEVGK
jgi:uncharacterized protein (TIGR04255 family)